MFTSNGEVKKDAYEQFLDIANWKLYERVLSRVKILLPKYCTLWSEDSLNKSQTFHGKVSFLMNCDNNNHK